MINVAVFDTKPYDCTALSAAATDLGWRFLEHRLSAETAGSGRGALAVSAGKPFLEGTVLVPGGNK